MTDVAAAWGDFVAGLGEWHLFGGLTYDQRRPGRVVVLPPQSSGEVWQAPPGRTLLSPRVSEDGRVRLDSQPVARDRAVAHVEYFLREGQRKLGRPIEAAVVALEYQKNGWPHFHPLLRLAGGLLDGDVRTLGPIWHKVAGYGRLEVPRSMQDVCAYASKYLAKGLEGGDVVLWPPRGDLRTHQLGVRSPVAQAHARAVGVARHRAELVGGRRAKA